MAETSTYKPKGTVLSPFEDSAKLKLKSVAQPIFEEFKTSGKVDANALNELAKTQNANLAEIVKYMLELVNQQSDTTTDKLKSELKNLADSLVADLKAQQNSDDKSAAEEKTTGNKNADIEKKLQEIKDTLGNDKSTDTKDEKIGEYSNFKIAENFQTLQKFVQQQMTKLQLKFPKLKLPKFKFPKLKFPKFKFPKFKFPKFKLPKFKFPKFKLPKLKLPKIQPLKRIKAIGSKVKNVASKAKNAVVKPFAAVGSFFKNLAFGSKTKFTFPKLTKFLKNFFNFKNVGKWLTGFLKKQVKIFQKMVEKIIKPIKKMLFGAIEMILNGLGRLLFIYLGPLAIAAWAILAIVTLIAVGLVLAVIWVKNWIKKNWNSIVKSIKNIPKNIWKGIKNLGKMLKKAIRFIFYDMWIKLGKWVWNKVLKPIGKWLNKKVVQPIVKFVKDKYNKFIKPIVDFIKEKYNKYIQPLVDSLSNLKKAIFDAFSWNSDKTVVENLMQIWTNIKTAIKNWWETSPFKQYYDKLTNWLSDLVKPIKDWWNGLDIKKTLTDIWDWVQNLASKVWDKIKGFFGGLVDIGAYIWKKLRKILPFTDTPQEEINKLTKKINEARKRGASDKYIKKLQAELSNAVSDRIEELQEDFDSGKFTKTKDAGWFDNTQVVSKEYKELTALKAKKDELIQQKVIIEQPEQVDSVSIDKESQAILSKELDSRFEQLANSLKTSFSNVQINFERILQKLDEKPNLIPIPFANTDTGNMALMENM